MPRAHGSVTLEPVESDIYRSPTPPENPYDGLHWHNTETGVLSVYSVGGEGEGSGWSTVANYSEATALIEELKEGTVDNPQFKMLLLNAESLQSVADKNNFLSTLAESMDFTPEGLNVYAYQKEFAARVAPQEFVLLKKVGELLEMAASFGLLKAITAPFLQVGKDLSGNPKIKIGGGVIEYNTATGNLTDRKG